MSHGSEKKRENVAASRVPKQASHPSAINSQPCVTKKWADLPLLHSATLQSLDNVNSAQKNLQFFAIIMHLDYGIGLEPLSKPFPAWCPPSW